MTTTPAAPGAKLLLHLHHAEIKRPMAYFVLFVGDHEIRSSQYDKETHPIFDAKLEFDLNGWFKTKPVTFEMFKKNSILKDAVVGGFHTTVADLLYMAGLSDDVGPAGIPSIKVTRTPDQPSNIQFWLDLSVGESDGETITGKVRLSLEIVNTKYILTPDVDCLQVMGLQGPKELPPPAEKKAAEPEPPKHESRPSLTSQSLSDLAAQKPTMTAEEAAAALAAQKAAAEPPPPATLESLAQDWWRQLTFDTKFIYAMTLHKKAANQLAKAVEVAAKIKEAVPDPNTANPATLVLTYLTAATPHHIPTMPTFPDPTIQQLANNPEAYTFAMWWFALGFATILIGTHPIPLFPDYDIITQFCNLMYSGGIVAIGAIFGYASNFRRVDVAVAGVVGVTTGMVCDFGSDALLTSFIVVALLAAGNGYPRAQIPLFHQFFTGIPPPPYSTQPNVLLAQGSQHILHAQPSQGQLIQQDSQGRLVTQGSQGHLVTQGPQTHLVPQGSQGHIVTQGSQTHLVTQGSQGHLAHQPSVYYISAPPTPKEQKVFKLNVTFEQVIAVIKFAMQESWAGRDTPGVLHYCNRGVGFGIGLLVGKFIMSGLYDMHGILYCAIMGAASAASPVIMGRQQKPHVS